MLVKEVLSSDGGHDTVLGMLFGKIKPRYYYSICSTHSKSLRNVFTVPRDKPRIRQEDHLLAQSTSPSSSG